jgi:hypothetical protein
MLQAWHAWHRGNGAGSASSDEVQGFEVLVGLVTAIERLQEGNQTR